jgi:hypothetical protein
MPPQFYENGTIIEHPLERSFNASGWDILSAIQHGHRAQTDVKGKLAEHFLHKDLINLEARGVLGNLAWSDKTGEPDFLFEAGGRRLCMECKNVRSGKPKFPGHHYVEVQKTRNPIAGGPSRGYRVDEFDILAACLFNQTGRWEYHFVVTADLQRRPDHPDYLVIYHPVPYCAQGVWKGTLEEVTGGLVPGA